MRFVFETRYRDSLRLFRRPGARFWYTLLLAAVLAVPWLLNTFYVGELTWVFIYAIAGIGLMLLVGYTGLVSLGHAAFLAIGAYTHAILLGQGWPWPLAVLAAVVLTALVGYGVGRPTLRMTGIYLAIATLAFAEVVTQLISHWEDLTGGFRGLVVPKAMMFGLDIGRGVTFYFVCLGILIFGLWLARNLVLGPTGRAMNAVRDSEVAAQSMGIDLAHVRAVAFAVSAGYTGLAGSALCPPDRLPGARRLHPPAVDSAPADGGRRRAWQSARGGARRGFPGTPTPGDRPAAGRVAARRGSNSRAGAGALRSDPGALLALRATRPLRALAQVASIPRGVSALSAPNPQATASLLAHRPLALTGLDGWHPSSAPVI